MEYIANVYSFHCLKTQINQDEKMKILNRINNLKCILDRIAPLESRLNSYLKDLTRIQQKAENMKQTPKIFPTFENDDMCLKPNLESLVLEDTEKLNPNLSNLVGPEEDSNDDEIKPIKRKKQESSVYVLSKSKYVPYDESQNQKLTIRERKEIQESKENKLKLQKSIIDDLMSVDNELPITTGMREPNNIGYFNHNKVSAKSNMKRDMSILKDRNYTLMMNDDEDEFVDKNLEELNQVLTKKLKSKKHQDKLKKRRELRTKFRIRNRKRR